MKISAKKRSVEPEVAVFMDPDVQVAKTRRIEKMEDMLG